MSIIKKFQEVTKVLNELSTAAVSARSEVQKLLTVLEGPAPVMSNMLNKVPLEDTDIDYVWSTDPTLIIDPITCGKFWDCDGREKNDIDPSAENIHYEDIPPYLMDIPLYKGDYYPIPEISSVGVEYREQHIIIPRPSRDITIVAAPVFKRDQNGCD